MKHERGIYKYIYIQREREKERERDRERERERERKEVRRKRVKGRTNFMKISCRNKLYQIEKILILCLLNMKNIMFKRSVFSKLSQVLQGAIGA